MADGGLRLMADGGLRPMADGGLRLMADGGLRLMADGGLRPMADGGLRLMADGPAHPAYLPSAIRHLPSAQPRSAKRYLTSTFSVAIPDRCASPSRMPTAMWCSPGVIFMCSVWRHTFDFAASYSATGISTICSLSMPLTKSDSLALTA